MGIFSTKIESMEALLGEQLEDLYDAEHRFAEALPKMAEATQDADLKAAFQEHTEETKGQINRLEKAFDLLNRDADRKTCNAAKGLVAEGEEVIGADAPDDVRDAGLIAAAQRVEHYEMAGYGSARSFAESLGHDAVAKLLQETLDEEGAADDKLTNIAKKSVNRDAVTSAPR